MDEVLDERFEPNGEDGDNASYACKLPTLGKCLAQQ
jgi:hypothetical protein